MKFRDYQDLFIVAIALWVIILAIGGKFDNRVQSQGAMIEYQYDTVHEVGIWMIKSSGGVGITVLPADKFKNPEKENR